MSVRKLSILFSLFYFLVPQLFSQEELLRVDAVIYKGINFIEATDWGEVLALAELEDKVIFLDAYTSWCRPCKKMDEVVFSRPDVGELYNGNFLNVRMDMENGDGSQLVQKYQVIAYPSLFFLYPDGSVLHRATGYKGPGAILKLGRQAKTNDNTVASLDEQFESGERSPEFLYQYVLTSIEAKDGRQTTLLEEYLETQQDWNTTEIQTLLFETVDTPDSPLFDHLLASKEAYANQFGASNVENKIQNLVYTAIRKSEQPLLTAPALFEKAYPDKAKQLSQHFRLNYYRDQEDGVNYAKEATAYLNNTPQVEEDFLNEITWNYYDLVTDQAAINILLKKVKKIRKSTNTYLNTESLALLYAKVGKTRKARKLTQKAIKLARAKKMSAASAEDLLSELKASK